MPPFQTPSPISSLRLPTTTPVPHHNDLRNAPYQITLTIDRGTTTITTTMNLGAPTTTSPLSYFSTSPATTSSPASSSVIIPSSNQRGGSHGPRNGAVIGAIIGSLVAFIFIMAILCICCSGRTFWGRKRERDWDSDSYYSYDEGRYVRTRGGSGGAGCLGWLAGARYGDGIERTSKRRREAVRVLRIYEEDRYGREHGQGRYGRRDDERLGGGGRVKGFDVDSTRSGAKRRSRSRGGSNARRSRKKAGFWEGLFVGDERRRRDRWYGEGTQNSGGSKGHASVDD